MTMTCARILFLSLIALASPAGWAAAEDSYPVSGRWTYDDAAAPGPATDCKAPVMEFRGAQRLDSRGGVPAFRNKRVEKTSETSYRVVDEFNNVQTRGQTSYTLSIPDKDHLRIDYDQGGKSVVLRRCP
jgi:hypothetical protein